MFTRTLIVVSLLMGAAGTAAGGSIRATPDRNIQEFVLEATYGDTVWVAPGEYGRVKLPAGVRLISEKGPAETIIKYGRLTVVQAEETDSLTVIEGFTIDGVRAAEALVGVKDGTATIRNCIFQNGWSGVQARYSTVTIEGCEFRRFRNGIYMMESDGQILDCDVRNCINGINLVSGTPRIARTVVRNNSKGILLTKHSNPSIGGSLASANQVHDNTVDVVNQALAREFGIRTAKSLTLEVPYNFWGTDCPDSVQFSGYVKFDPWVDESGKRSLESCPPSAAN